MSTKKLFLTAMFVAYAAIAAHAGFDIEPIVLDINVNRGENSGWIELTNTGDGPIAIELLVYERTLNLEGEIPPIDSLVRSKDFVIHPARVVLSPKQKARVQAAYRNKQKITADKAYLLFSKEVPLKIEEEKEGVTVGVNTLLNYYTIIAMNTGKAGALTFVSSKPIGDGKIEVIAENKSGGRVSGERLSIFVGNKKITSFTGKKNSVMPGQKRRFTFEFERAVTANEVRFVN